MAYEELFLKNEYFHINVNAYDSSKNYEVVRPSSLGYPRDNAVMFIQRQYMKYVDVFDRVSDCLIFWPVQVELPEKISKRHVVVVCEDPHLEFCRFFKRNNITNFVKNETPKLVDNYMTVGNVEIGEGTQVFPYVYMNGNIRIGRNCYIASGVRIIGNVWIGDNVLIKENAVLGADGLTTDREPDGTAASMPQFGGLIIENNVQIGANTIIARGAIDNTVISKGCKIDNNCSVSHNNFFGENVFMVGESTTFGSVTIGKNTQISGNSTVRNGITVGERCLVGAGSMVMRNIKDGKVVSGNPAKEMYFPGM